MRGFKYFSDFERLSKEVRWQAVIIYALLAIVLLEGILLWHASNKKVVVVIPPKVDKEFWVSGDTLSYAYMEQVAVYVADSLLSVSPANVDKALSRITPFLTTEPEQAKVIRDSFAGYAKAVKNNDWYQAFYPMKVSIDQKNQKIVVYGILRKMTGNLHIADEPGKTVELGYTVQNGRLIIREVKF